ncbi:nucleotide exchange factor GrpE [Nocardioides mesophilus]|uniref:Protein GrpE n=1 Tax=Nocardioides mesophilus TaxID=433659 RepID=A0A7G9RF34_9ACTN|nr:nucleotide exchange factor GrpE [Nocardioides mesophilus]QNN54209.1 nucleotide exchange factor GrpE [Nocardioides mesophilus]
MTHDHTTSTSDATTPADRPDGAAADAAAATREPQEAAAPGAAGYAEEELAGHAGSPDSPGDVAEESSTDLLADLAGAQSRVAALTEDLQRLQAEYVNYKRRVDRDRELVLENARFSVLAALLPVLDDVDRAREHGELEGGFKAVAESLERIVAAQGLTKFGAPGDEFDPRFHEALMHAHSAEVTTTTCRDVVSAGYQIGERVVRPARVTVVDPEPAGD